jgi:hypothetical protein
MADFDFNNIFGNNNTDISNILFDENQLYLIRDQFQKEVINPLFDQYKSFYKKIEDKISENSNNNSYIKKSSDIIDIENYKKNRNIDKRLDDIINPFFSKMENFYDKLGQSLYYYDFKKILPDINFTNLNDKIQKKISDIENNLNSEDLKESVEPLSQKRKTSKLKARSIPMVEDISEEITKQIEPVEDKKASEITKQIEPVEDKTLTEDNKNFTVNDFSEELTNNITVLIEETASNKTLLEKINDSMFSIKSFTSTYFSIFDKVMADYLPDLVKNDNVSGKIGAEQKKIGDEIPEVSLSEKTINYLKDIFIGFNISDKKEELVGDTNLTDKIQEEGGFWSNLLYKIGGILLAGGLLMSAIGPLWDNMFKPWLEDKLGIKIKSFDDILGKFSKIWDGMEKWLTLGGVGGVGFGLKMQGQVFETIGDIIEKSIGSIFGKVGGEAFGEGAGKLASFFPKIGAKLFGGLSKTLLKAIPFVGSLFSFYFAKQDYDSGDYVSMGFNIVSGLANLIPGYGIFLSLGLDVLNGMLEFNTGDAKTMEEKQGMKIDFLGKMVEFIQEIPLVGGLIKWGKGFYALGQGNWKEALDYLTETPFLGPFPAILQAMVNSGTFGGDGSESFSWDKFNDELKKSMFRWMCSFIPKVGGMRKSVANWLGITYDDNTGDLKIDENALSVTEQLNQEVVSDAQKQARQRLEQVKGSKKPNIFSQKNLDEIQKNIDDAQAEKEKLEQELKSVLSNRIGPSIPFLDKKSRDERISDAMLEPANNLKGHQERELKQALDIANSNLKEYRILKQKQLEAQFDENAQIEEKKADDFFDSSNNSFSDISNISEGKYYYNPQNNTRTYLNQDDDVYALKRGGIIEENINKQLGEFTNILLAGLRELKDNSNGGSYINTPVNNISVSNSSNNQSSDYGGYTTGKRDPIFDLRSDWWRSSTTERIA